MWLTHLVSHEWSFAVVITTTPRRHKRNQCEREISKSREFEPFHMKLATLKVDGRSNDETQFR